jgi:hypothetical protein
MSRDDVGECIPDVSLYVQEMCPMLNYLFLGLLDFEYTIIFLGLDNAPSYFMYVMNKIFMKYL